MPALEFSFLLPGFSATLSKFLNLYILVSLAIVGRGDK